MKIYMLVTRDEYELPIAVADNPKDLAIMLGTTVNVVQSSISHHRAGWIRVETEEAEDED